MFALVAFEHEGVAQEVVCFGTEKYGEAKGLSIGIDLPSGTWHIIVALVQDSVLLELKLDRLIPRQPKSQRCGHPMGDRRMLSLIFLSSMALWFAILAFAGVMGFLWCVQINLDYCGC